MSATSKISNKYETDRYHEKCTLKTNLLGNMKISLHSPGPKNARRLHFFVLYSMWMLNGVSDQYVKVDEMLDEFEWSSLEARRDQSFLLLFHKIRCGAVSIEKDKYMTPTHSLKTTRPSHSAQYHRQQTYSDALKNSFFPRIIPHWNSLSPVANIQSTDEIRALLN